MSGQIGRRHAVEQRRGRILVREMTSRRGQTIPSRGSSQRSDRSDARSCGTLHLYWDHASSD